MSGCKQLAAFLCAAGIVAPSVAVAGVELPQADLSLSIVASPPQPLYPPGSIVRIDYTVHNAGPDTAPGAYVGAGTFAFEGPNSQVVLSSSGDTAPCVYAALDFEPVEGFHGYWITTLTFPEIPADASATCSLTLTVLDTARGNYVLEGRANSAVSGETSEDPNPDNDTFTLSLPLTDGPAPVTDLAITMELVPAQALYSPGSEVRLHVTARNDGPDPSGGSLVSFDPTWASNINAPAAILPPPILEGPRPCTHELVPSQSGEGFTVESVQFRGLDVGESITCQYRFLVLDVAPDVFTLRAASTPEPDFGEPTDDPNPDNDSANLIVRVSQSTAVTPTVVPTLQFPSVFLMIVALAAFAFRRLRTPDGV